MPNASEPAAPSPSGSGSLPPLGAHVSAAGGVSRAPGRAAELEATALQIFTGQPRRWAEPDLGEEECEAFRRALAGSRIRAAGAHDSYLINLASEKPELHRKSVAAFEAELARCVRLGLDFLVTHPGNATAGDRRAGLERNARALEAAVAAVSGPTRILVETTAGSGTALGWRFEELAALLEEISSPARDRMGVCLDTAHVFAAGYDLRERYEDVMAEFDRIVGLERLALLHVNDSRVPLGSRVDRHAHIGRGELGEAAFRSLVRDPRLREVPRIIETPKDDDATEADRRNLERLRRLALEDG